MIPNEPSGTAAPRPNDSRPNDSVNAVPARAAGGPPVRLVLLVLAVILAGAGLVALIVILAAAWLQVPLWPGWVLLAYACLPLGFLLMATVVFVGVLARRRS
ncbi:hypothetical protein [Arthrobacter sp. H41]|uniref:hypothetical protein n=1 Tax=Arthrobacter sp. H41 TaxID=1312978 RepID=UPI0004B0D881|nr:hypothetical protein [Arthrobacter sp. H41]